MLDRRESGGRLAADPLSGRVGGLEGGETGFEGLEGTIKFVILAVGDFGRGLDVVEPVMSFQLPGEPGDFVKGLGFGHEGGTAVGS
jgi:hypothetical protein